jgi:hypothetical protein
MVMETVAGHMPDQILVSGVGYDYSIQTRKLLQFRQYAIIQFGQSKIIAIQTPVSAIYSIIASLYALRSSEAACLRIDGPLSSIG